MGSGMDLGAIEYGVMEIGLIWISSRVGIVSIGQWSNLGRTDRVLVGKYFNPDLGRSIATRPTRPLLD